MTDAPENPQSITKGLTLSNRAQTMIVLSVLCGMGLYLGGAVFTDIREVGAQASTIPIAIWLLLLGTSLINYALRFLRWNMMISHTGGRLPLARHGLFYIAGFALTTTPGKAGEAIRSIYMHRYGVPVRDCIAALFTERLLDLFSISILAVMAVGILASGTVVIASALGLFLICSLVIVSPLPYLVLDAVIRSRPEGKLGSVAQKARALVESSRKLQNWRVFLGGNVTGLIAWGAEGIGLYILLGQLGTDVSLPLALGIYGASVLVGALSFLPGGLGTTELTMTAMLVAVGVPASTAILATIVCRLVTLWFAVVLGFAAMLVAARIEVPHE